jgi:DNA replication protein DnaC
MTNHSDEPKSNGKIIDFEWCVKFFEKRGQEIYGPNFRIIPEDHEIIYKLVVYFLGHEDEAKRLGLDLRKGIMLTGPIGCGKTSLMSLMRLVPAKDRNFTMKTARDISFEFIQEGYDVINRYSKLSFTGSGPRIYCFDDLGAEQNLKYYGNSCNVMGEILLSRYDLFNSQGMISHVTTNLGAAEIEKLYGERVRSRMREMLNLLSFSEGIKDKRK